MRYLNAWVLFACVVLCLAINWLMGKDMNADMLAYHVYSAHMFWTGGYRDEFMGAGLQSFFNPVGYLPFYWMLKAGWPSLLIASCLAVIHALNLFMVWMICRNFLFRGMAQCNTFSALGVLLAGASPVFIAMLGSSFLDPVQSAMMLCGLYLVMLAVTEDRHRMQLVIGGLLLGAATGLKPTVAATPIFCLLSLALVTWRATSVANALRRSIQFGSGVALGGLLTAGFWAAHLWQRFGSPVFPFANDVFKAPDFFAVPLTTDRFIAQGLMDVLSFPFRMAKINSGIYVEIAAPDLRFALLVLVLVALILVKLSKRQPAQTGDPKDPPSAPVQVLWIVFVAVVILWMAKLGNGRYHLMYLLLVGPLLVWALVSLLGDRRLSALAAGLILVLQLAHGVSSGYPRWESASWTESWVKTWWPSQLDFNASTFAQLGPGIDTMVFADFPVGSRFVDLGGKFPVSPDSPLGHKMKVILADQPQNTFAVFKSRASEERDWRMPRQMSAEAVSQINHLLAPWNLQMADGTCHPMEIELDRDELNTQGGHSVTLGVRRYALMLCRINEGGQVDTQIERQRNYLAQLAGHLTTTCPTLFPAPASLPTQLAGVWNIRYIGSDIVVALHKGELTYSRYPLGPFNVPIQIEQGTGLPKLECRSNPSSK